MNNRRPQKSERPKYTLDLPATVLREYERCPLARTTVREMSSGVVAFDGDSSFLLDSRVKLAIAWPARHHMGAALQLRIEGEVIKTEGDRCEVKIRTHEFRVSPCGQFAAPPQIEGPSIRPTAV